MPKKQIKIRNRGGRPRGTIGSKKTKKNVFAEENIAKIVRKETMNSAKDYAALELIKERAKARRENSYIVRRGTYSEIISRAKSKFGLGEDVIISRDSIRI